MPLTPAVSGNYEESGGPEAIKTRWLLGEIKIESRQELTDLEKNVAIRFDREQRGVRICTKCFGAIPSSPALVIMEVDAGKAMCAMCLSESDAHQSKILNAILGDGDAYDPVCNASAGEVIDLLTQDMSEEDENDDLAGEAKLLKFEREVVHRGRVDILFKHGVRLMDPEQREYQLNALVRAAWHHTHGVIKVDSLEYAPDMIIAPPLERYNRNFLSCDVLGRLDLPTATDCDICHSPVAHVLPGYISFSRSGLLCKTCIDEWGIGIWERVIFSSPDDELQYRKKHDHLRWDELTDILPEQRRDGAVIYL